MKSSERVLLGWIDPGQVDGMFALSVAELSRWRSNRLAGLIRIEGGLVSRQRNECVATFLDGQVEWLLLVDSDQQISVDAFDKMVGAAHALDRPVVCGLYFGAQPSAGMFPQPIPHLYRQSTGVRMTPIVDYPADRVIEVDAGGTGAMLVHRSVLEKIQASADTVHEGDRWCWFRDLPIDGNWLGEDFYFCRRIRSLGFPIHAHTGAILPHRKRYWLDERQHEAARAMAREVSS